MKNWEIRFIVENGILNITSHDLDAANAYKVVRFKSCIRTASDSLTAMEESVIKEVGIDNPAYFNERRNELTKKENLTESEIEELQGLNAKMMRYNELVAIQLNADAGIESNPMPYEQWKVLQDENRNIKVGDAELLILSEASLEDILWRAPEE